MKHSIKKEITVIFLLLIIGIIVICMLMNTVFLEKFYMSDKQQTLLTVYDWIDKKVQNDDITSSDFVNKFNETCDSKNISVLVTTPNWEEVLSSSGHDMVRRMQMIIFGLDPDKGDELVLGSSIKVRVKGSIVRHTEKIKILKRTDMFTLQLVVDDKMNTEYMELWGYLDNGDMILLRTAVESIRDSVKLSNRFLVYIFIIALVISILLVWYLAKRVSRPILELADISKQMGGLDFTAKYSGGEKNEIGILGNNMNQMSKTLETVIGELKTANNELQKDIEKKEEIDIMRREFLSNVSHELKTPIALIQGYAEGLKECVNDDEESRDFYCDVIMDEANRMNNMVKKLLTLNQLEFGTETVTLERFNLTALIKGVIQSSNILIKQKGATVIFQDTPEIYVWADELKIEDVVRNYLSNAWNHAAGEKVIEVKIQKVNGKARVSVFNTGEPIPEESLDQIWVKFYKVDKARTREYGGSGIGLSIVKVIMDSFNQPYGVRNYDNGVEFWFELESDVQPV